MVVEVSCLLEFEATCAKDVDKCLGMIGDDEGGTMIAAQGDDMTELIWRDIF